MKSLQKEAVAQGGAWGQTPEPRKAGKAGMDT